LTAANTGTERHKPRDTEHLPGSLERLPVGLEALVRAATADSLPKSATLETSIIPDLNRWVLAWAAAYLLRSPDAREHLELAYREWQTHLERILN
jgi:hypothetical protein